MESSDFHARLISRKIAQLRTKISEREMSDRGAMTTQSIAYRRKASDVGKKARALGQTDQAQELALLQQAISWVQLAENEELLAADQLTELQ